MQQVSIKKPGFYLFLISLTFLVMWILFAISFILSPLISNLLISLELSRYIYIFLFYLFSILLPAVGLIFFMNYIKNSSRWYLGIPLLIAVFLMTFLRDSMTMARFYSVSFISAYDTLQILDSMATKAFIQIFFSLSALLFVLSVPESKAKLMKMPFRMAIVASASIIIYHSVAFFVYIPENQLFGFLHIISIFLLGLLLLRAAINYDEE